MSTAICGRRVFNVDDPGYRPYDLEGPVQPEMSWLPVSFERSTGEGCYLMRMQPGAATIAHTHPGMEEFLIVDGELIDGDGTVFKAGDFVSYAPGTRHSSRTETGCVIAVFEWRPSPAASPR
jgi:anti-sigma factor ChrR (cupin superfamily)